MSMSESVCQLIGNGGDGGTLPVGWKSTGKHSSLRLNKLLEFAVGRRTKQGEVLSWELWFSHLFQSCGRLVVSLLVTKYDTSHRLEISNLL